MRLDAFVTRVGNRLAAFFRAQPQPVVAPAAFPGDDPLGYGVADISPTDLWTRGWRVSRDREQRHNIRDRMDTEDSVISSVLDLQADVATAPDDDAADITRAFDVACKDDATREEAERVTEALGLQRQSWGIARRVLKYGNEMRELVVDAAASRVVNFKLLPENQMWARRDKYGNPAAPPWEQREYSRPDGTGIAFAAWQICHYLFREDDLGMYGRGLLDCERDWQRLQAIEDGMVQARLSRAYDKLKHRVPVPQKSSGAEQAQLVRNYRLSIARRRMLDAVEGSTSRDNPTNVLHDFYVPYHPETLPDAGPIPLPSSNIQLQNIRDVDYMRARVLAKLATPMRYLNMGGTEAVRASLGEGGQSYEDKRFARTIRRLQAALGAGHERVIVYHLILRGLNPILNPITLQFPPVSTSDAALQADVDLKRAQTLQIIAGLIGVPVGMIVDHYMGLTAEEQEKWFGDLTEAAQAAVPRAPVRYLGEEHQELKKAAASLLYLAQRKLDDLDPGEEGRLAVGGGHGANYPGPAFGN